MRRVVRAVERPTILVDSREQRPLRFSDAVGMEIVTLVTGDYSLRGASELVALERKSIPDFVACCTRERERFIEQVERLAMYQVRALIIEGTWDGLSAGCYRSRTNPRSVTGTLLALAVDYALPVLLAGTAINAAEIVERVLLRVWRKRAEAAA